MQSDMDLSHIIKQMQKLRLEVQAVRRQATHEWDVVNQHYKEGKIDDVRYYEQQADTLERQADDLETQIDQLETVKARIENRIKELEAVKAKTSSDHTEHLKHINEELGRLRGSQMML